MGKLQKLRSRFFRRLMVVRSKVDLLPAPIENRIESTEESDRTARDDDLQSQANVGYVSASPMGAFEELHWNEARRIYSEPTAELYHSESLSSLASQESDDVFLEGGADNERLQCRTGTHLGLEGGYVGAWEDWKIPASEISLGTVISCTKREIIYSGYWHGSVHVHMRTAREVQDFDYFLEEVATLSCIRHENIQLFMGVCLDMTGGTLAIMMSEVKGDSLHTRLHKYGHNFTNPSKTKILKQITEGVEYLHAKGIPHGALSTQCISLHYRVCISVAPQVQSSRSLEAWELTYLPPESVRQLWVQGERTVLHQRPTFACDVFAFGTIVYELVALEHPFSTLPLQSLIWQVGQGATQPLTMLPKGRFRSIISRCWKENPTLRPSFNDILASIEQNILPLPPLYTEAQNNSSNHALTAELKDCRTIKSINYCEDTCCVTQMQSAWPLVYCPYCCSFRYTMCVLEQLGGKGRYTCGHMDCMHQHYH